MRLTFLQRLAKSFRILGEGATPRLSLHAPCEHIHRRMQADDRSARLGARTILRTQQRASAKSHHRIRLLSAEILQGRSLNVAKSFPAGFRHVLGDGHSQPSLYKCVEIQRFFAERNGEVPRTGGLPGCRRTVDKKCWCTEECIHGVSPKGEWKSAVAC